MPNFLKRLKAYSFLTPKINLQSSCKMNLLQQQHPQDQSSIINLVETSHQKTVSQLDIRKLPPLFFRHPNCSGVVGRKLPKPPSHLHQEFQLYGTQDFKSDHSTPSETVHQNTCINELSTTLGGSKVVGGLAIWDLAVILGFHKPWFFWIPEPEPGPMFGKKEGGSIFDLS